MNRCYYQVLQQLRGVSVTGCLGQSSGWPTRLQLLPTPGPPCPLLPQCLPQHSSAAPSSTGFSTHSLAWRDPSPDVASTYFLSHIVHCSPFINLTHKSNQPARFCHTSSAFSYHCASPHPVPFVSRPCKCQLYTRCGKGLSPLISLL